MERQLLKEGKRLRLRAGLSSPDPHPLTDCFRLEANGGLRARRPPSDASGPLGQVPHRRKRKREKERGSWFSTCPAEPGMWGYLSLLPAFLAVWAITGVWTV